ncbi:Zn-dependent hydrolase [Mesorhizobium sp. B2-4-19]|uniref:Zn-dependent hydrolase n=1 Tax=Mesorhizobium sp. B2-4-19 TaxID=2589930 RepID=UPI001127AF7B|nr:Zn-dependent hydrolase [Mesorhizobium sp. B2-4-19]TPK59128.1 Zn-dependent hydrolase [Mesorhizobium sp. B2-4-19]
MTNALEIDGRRLWDTLMVSATIGAGMKGGLCRLALTDQDKTMRDLFVRWCREAGCSVEIDKVGNIFARRIGLDPALKPVLIGSHLDTQIAGGRFDGILGVLAGLEVVRTLNDKGVQTRRSIEVVCWTNEEGVRFQPPMMGAGAFAGVHDVDWVLAQPDDAGTLLGAELARIGYRGEQDRDRTDIDCYFELHIEQGPVLEEEGVDVGIVTGGFTSFGAEIHFTGENAHCGPTPMKARKDPLVAAAILIAKANEIGWGYEPNGRATCARIEVSPNRYGIIADSADVIVDVRHPDAGTAAEMYREVLDTIAIATKQARVVGAVVKEWSFGNIAFDAGLINLIRTVSADLGVSHKHMLSAAGHDAYHVSKVAPAAMIFTPCRNGITHNEAEHIELEYTVPGVNVLLNAVVRRANT